MFNPTTATFSGPRLDEQGDIPPVQMRQKRYVHVDRYHTGCHGTRSDPLLLQYICASVETSGAIIFSLACQTERALSSFTPRHPLDDEYVSEGRTATFV